MIASLRYLDRFAKIDGAWFFEERNLVVDWTETRPSPRKRMVEVCAAQCSWVRLGHDHAKSRASSWSAGMMPSRPDW